MLNLEQIAQRIQSPELCTVQDIDDLKLFTSNYPYAQIFPILYLKGLANNNDIRFEAELTHFAYRIPDRVQLYNLIHQSENVAVPKETASNQLEEMQEAIRVEITEEPVSHFTLIPEEKTEVQKIEAKIAPLELASEELVETTKAIDNQKLESVSNSSIQEERLSEEFEEEDSEDVFIPLNITSIDDYSKVLEKDKLTSDSEKNAVSDEKINTQINEEDSEDSALINFDKEILSVAITSNYNLDYLTIEKNLPEETNLIDENLALKSEEIAIDITTKRSFSSWLQSNENFSDQIYDDEKARIDNLVNQFIETEPKISRPSKEQFEEPKPKKEFFSPVKKAKESLDMNSMPVSETLAKIFALQGNFPKAIFAYQQLILINPEKKIFFASQIVELQKKLNI
jgi:hypothetical protein